MLWCSECLEAHAPIDCIWVLRKSQHRLLAENARLKELLSRATFCLGQTKQFLEGSGMTALRPEELRDAIAQWLPEALEAS